MARRSAATRSAIGIVAHAIRAARLGVRAGTLKRPADAADVPLPKDIGGNLYQLRCPKSIPRVGRHLALPGRYEELSYYEHNSQNSLTFLYVKA